MMPTLPVALPPRPEPTLATPPEATNDAADTGPGTFARELRKAEAPDACADTAPDGASVRNTPHPAPRERTGPGRTRAGDTPEPNPASRANAAPSKADAAETPETDAAAVATPHDNAAADPAIESSVDDATVADSSIALLDASALPLPSLPPSLSHIALDRHAPHGNGDVPDGRFDGGLSGRRATALVGGHTLPGRHPSAVANARAPWPNGVAAPALPGEARARVDERAVDPTILASAAATKLAATEPALAASVSNMSTEPFTTLPWSTGAATPALDGLAGRAAADPIRPVAEARLPAELGGPAFTQALGAQMGVWLRDGVQEARIQLNPADLGPVQIQITLDGQSAQVDFHAAHARTREAIEASLPALASALRESGFTLAGGGVFGQGSGDTPARTPVPAPHGLERSPLGQEALDDSGDDGLAAAAARSRGWRRGLLDVFA